MSRYIDADRLISEIEWLKTQVNNHNKEYYDEMIERIDTMPAIDSLMVRCKFCKFFSLLTGNYPDVNGYCILNDDSHSGDFFCADGERITNADK